MVTKNVIQKPVRATSDVQLRVGELLERADMQQDATNEAVKVITEAVQGMNKNLVTMTTLVDELEDNGGSAIAGSNGSAAELLAEVSQQVEASNKNTQEVNDTFETLSQKIELEQEERKKTVEDFLASLDDSLDRDRKQQAYDRLKADEGFYDQLLSVAKQGSASAQSDALDALLATPSTAETVSGGLESLTGGLGTATDLVSAAGSKGTGGISKVAGLLGGAGGALKFLGPVGAALGAVVGAVSLIESGIDFAQGLRSSSIEATGTDSNLLTGLEQSSQAKLTSFTSSLSEDEAQIIQQGLMSGGATYGTQTYNTGYDWVVSANQNYNIDPRKATDLYVQQVVRGGQSVEYLSEMLEGLAETAAETGASMSEVYAEYESFANTFSQTTGSSVVGASIAADFTSWFGGGTGQGAEMVESLVNYASNDTIFRQARIEGANQGLSTSESYVYAMQQYLNHVGSQSTRLGEAISYVLNGDREGFKEFWNRDETTYQDKELITQEIANLFNGGQPLDINTDDADEFFDYLQKPIVTDANKVLRTATGEGISLDDYTSGTSDELSSHPSIYGATSSSLYQDGGSAANSSLDLSAETVLGIGDFGKLSNEEVSSFLQLMLSTGHLTEKDLAGMSESDLAQVYKDTAWSWSEYGSGGAYSWIEKDFSWETKDKDWFGRYDNGAQNEPVALTIGFEDDAEKLIYVKAANGRAAYMEDNNGRTVTDGY